MSSDTYRKKEKDKWSAHPCMKRRIVPVYVTKEKENDFFQKLIGTDQFIKQNFTF